MIKVVILSAACSSRSEKQAKSKDPYDSTDPPRDSQKPAGVRAPLSGGWPILNFALFAKFRVGILRRRSSRNRRHESMNGRQEDSVQQWNCPTQAKTGLGRTPVRELGNPNWARNIGILPWRKQRTRVGARHSTACRKSTPISSAFRSRPCLLKSASTSFHHEKRLPCWCLQFCLPFSTWLKSYASSVA